MVGISTSTKTAEKHKYSMQKCIDLVERKQISLANNVRIKMSLKTQKERKKKSVIENRHRTDAHSNAPLKFLSIQHENNILDVVWNYQECNLTMLESLMFLSFWNLYMDTFLRFDSLHTTCFEDVHYHVEEGPHNLKTSSRVRELTGYVFFEPAILLLIQSY